MIEIGIDSFASAMYGDNNTLSSVDAMEQLLQRIELADQVGLDVFGIGEHHKKEFLDSATAVILSAAAARTKNIRLASAVSVLSAADPVRVYQEFATLDLVSKGRAEIVVGRGSSIEAYPLFGFNLNDYDALFKEKWCKNGCAKPDSFKFLTNAGIQVTKLIPKLAVIPLINAIGKLL